jgi:hypothetical protein
MIHLGVLVMHLVLLLLGFLGDFVRILLAHNNRLGVSLLFQIQSHLVQAGLGFVVDARGPLLVGRKLMEHSACVFGGGGT